MRSKFILFAILPALLLGLFFTGCSKSGGGGGAKKYHCPMHPTYITDKPGDCPICGMKLVPIKAGEKIPAATNKPATTAAATTAEPQTKAKVGEFYCPMDANVVSNAPGRCPECHMKLLLKTNEVAAASSAAPSEHAGHTTSSAEAPVPGRIGVMLNADKQQLIGLKSAKVEKRELAVTIRTTATFEHDETRLAKISPRFGGWVRDLKVNFTGRRVEKGEPLLTVYSPELLATENEYLLAFQRFGQLKNSPGVERDGAQRLLDSARRRLLLWQIGDEEIRALEQSGQPKDELLLRAPVSGHVVSKTAVEGKSFMAGETLYEIADLSHLWLRAYVYEYEFPLVKVGQKAEVVLPYLGNKTYESKITFLYPHIEQQTRRAEIRLEVDNPKHDLRPAMWADVRIQASYGTVTAIPASAVIDTGTRFITFVKHEEHLQPRELKIGVRTDDFWEVVSGVKEGEEVVTRALFLVDSESQLKAAIEGMGSAGGHQH